MAAAGPRGARRAGLSSGRVYEVDFLWRARRLAALVDGWQFHRTRQDRERDAAADSALELAGLRVMRLTWDDTGVREDVTSHRLRAAMM